MVRAILLIHPFCWNSVRHIFTFEPRRPRRPSARRDDKATVRISLGDFTQGTFRWTGYQRQCLDMRIGKILLIARPLLTLALIVLLVMYLGCVSDILGDGSCWWV